MAAKVLLFRCVVTCRVGMGWGERAWFVLLATQTVNQAGFLDQTLWNRLAAGDGRDSGVALAALPPHNSRHATAAEVEAGQDPALMLGRHSHVCPSRSCFFVSSLSWKFVVEGQVPARWATKGHWPGPVKTHMLFWLACNMAL